MKFFTKYMLSVCTLLALVSFNAQAEYFRGKLSEGFIVNGTTGYQLEIFNEVEKQTEVYQLVVAEDSENIFLVEETFNRLLELTVWVDGEKVVLPGSPWLGGVRDVQALKIVDIGQVFKINPTVRVGN